jgi:hypothetical protein
MKYLRTITAASVLAVSAFANAETSLSQIEMDGVNASGFAFADAIANALGTATSAWTNTAANVVSYNIIPGQFGAVFAIASDALAEAASDSDAKAIAVATGYGMTDGTLLSDTESYAATATDTDAVLPSSVAVGWNNSIAASLIIGLSSSASSSANSSAALHN